jgi:hypothetical protein
MCFSKYTPHILEDEVVKLLKFVKNGPGRHMGLEKVAVSF